LDAYEATFFNDLCGTHKHRSNQTNREKNTSRRSFIAYLPQSDVEVVSAARQPFA
jgi:hypothetical protein